MQSRCKGLTIKTREEIKGYYCQVEGGHFIIPDNAYLGRDHQDIAVTIEEFAEVGPETVGQLLDKHDIDYMREKVKEFDAEKEKLDSFMSMGR